jgi:Flp pilus assembly protein TadG
MVATEFALIAPVMITMFFAVTELSDGLEAGTKVTSVASTAADLIAQEKSVCNAEMTDVFAALNSIMFPYPTNNMGIRISSLIDGGNGIVRVAWSDAQNMAPRTVNSTVAVPAGLVTAGGSVIFAEVAYTYNSTTGQYIVGAQTVSDRFYLHPRRVAQIPRTANGC